MCYWIQIEFKGLPSFVGLLLDNKLESAATRDNSSHYNDVTMSAMASQITGVTIVYLIVCSGEDER